MAQAVCWVVFLCDGFVTVTAARSLALVKTDRRSSSFCYLAVTVTIDSAVTRTTEEMDSTTVTGGIVINTLSTERTQHTNHVWH